MGDHGWGIRVLVMGREKEDGRAVGLTDVCVLLLVCTTYRSPKKSQRRKGTREGKLESWVLLETPLPSM